PGSSAQLRPVRVPTLIVVGQDDQVSPPDAAHAMAALIPGAQCHVIPAAGHLAPLEQPLATGRLLADFLSGLPRQTKPRAVTPGALPYEPVRCGFTGGPRPWTT